MSTTPAPDAHDAMIHHGSMQDPIPTPESKKSSSARLWAAYLVMAMPYNFAMAAEWQPLADATPRASSHYQLAAATTQPPSYTPPRYFQITTQDLAKEVAQQLEAQGIAPEVQATVNPMASTVLLSADYPLKFTLHGLQIDEAAGRWQAQAYILSNQGTETVKPVSGRYEALEEIPVLRHSIRPTDIITAEDLHTVSLPARRLRKDTVRDAHALIGQSARGMISSQRPIRSSEISAPVLIKKGDMVEMRYQTPYMQIRTTGIALENGLAGGNLRVKNEKSEKAITARVIAAGQVAVGENGTLN